MASLYAGTSRPRIQDERSEGLEMKVMKYDRVAAAYILHTPTEILSIQFGLREQRSPS